MRHPVADVVFLNWAKLPHYQIRITINRHILINFATFMNLYTTFGILRLPKIEAIL